MKGPMFYSTDMPPRPRGGGGGLLARPLPRVVATQPALQFEERRERIATSDDEFPVHVAFWRVNERVSGLHKITYAGARIHPGDSETIGDIEFNNSLHYLVRSVLEEYIQVGGFLINIATKNPWPFTMQRFANGDVSVHEDLNTAEDSIVWQVLIENRSEEARE